MRRPALSPTAAGLIALLLVVAGTYLAFARGLPFGSQYEIEAVFRSAVNVKERQPVRIAGVDVGEVTGVRHLRTGREAAVVTMRIDERGRPIKRDATVTIRPRMLLEGNWFLEVEPGTPGAEELPDGGVVPIAQTRTPVQLGQVLTALQSDVRRNLQTLLREYSSALAADGAEGFRRSIRWWEAAYRDSSLVQRAMLGVREHDLSEYVDAGGRTARGFSRDRRALRGLIEDFDTAAGAFARESVALEQAVAELPRTLAAGRPALAALNRSLPPLRRFTRDLHPSVRELDETVDVTLPFLGEARGLVSRPELRGLAHDLRPTVPALARLIERTRPLFEEVRLASGCENEVLEEWSNDRVPDERFPARGRVFEEAPKPLVGLAGESRSGDANGQWIRILGGGGDRMYNLGDGRFAQAYLPLLGTNPPKPQALPPLRADVPCETQAPPDLRTIPGRAGTEVARGLPDTPQARRRFARAKARALRWARRQLRIEGLERQFEVRNR